METTQTNVYIIYIFENMRGESKSFLFVAQITKELKIMLLVETDTAAVLMKINKILPPTYFKANKQSVLE